MHTCQHGTFSSGVPEKCISMDQLHSKADEGADAVADDSKEMGAGKSRSSCLSVVQHPHEVNDGSIESW